MSSSRLVRGAKTRTIGCICLVLLLGALVYLFQGTQSRLADVQKIANSCSQQTESLSAQLEVLFEYKLRLEKSLQTEKQDRKKLAEEYEKKLKDSKEEYEKEKAELLKKYDNLNNEKTNLQLKMDESRDNYDKQISDLNAENTDIKSSVKMMKEKLDNVTVERNDLKGSVDKMKNEVDNYKREIEDLKTKNLPSNEQILKLEQEKRELRNKVDELQKEIDSCKKDKFNVQSLVGRKSEETVLRPEDNKHALEAPAFNDEIDTGDKGSSTTTPKINLQAVLNQDVSTKTSTRQTQENKPEPLAQPVPNMGIGSPGMGQIPEPPDDIPGGSIGKNINMDESHISNQIDQWDDPHKGEMNNAAIEELAEAPLQGEEDKGPRSRDEPDKEYKEQGDEDDEEEERMGDFGHQPHMRGNSQLIKFSSMDVADGGGGVMINPK